MVTTALSGQQVASRVEGAFPGVVVAVAADSITVAAENVVDVALFLRDDPELDCKYLNTLLGIDWLDHFDVVYVVSSLARNHSFVLRARSRHESPIVPSVSNVWLGAHLQEREVYDLMGIAFSDHPDLKRIFLWEGFPGHPLRKDFLALPGGYKPGLQRFPFEFPAGQRSYPGLTDTDTPMAPEVPLLPSMPYNAQPVPPGSNAAGGQLGVLGGGVQGTRAETQVGPLPTAGAMARTGSGSGGGVPPPGQPSGGSGSAGEEPAPTEGAPQAHGQPETRPYPEATAGPPETKAAPSDIEKAPPDARPGANA